MATLGLRDELNVCQLCGVLENLSLCGGCKGAWYCSKNHQRQDWRTHKSLCKKTKQLKSDDLSVSEENCVKTKTDDSNNVATQSSISRSSCRVNSGHTIKSAQDPECSTTIKNQNVPLTKECSASSSIEITGQTGDEEKHPKAESMGMGCCDKNGSGLMIPDSGARIKIEKSKSQKGSSTKKKQKIISEQIGISQDRSERSSVEDSPPVQRYYLNKTTQKINLPTRSTAFKQTKNSSSEMGKDESLSPEESREQYLCVLRSRFTVLSKYVVECLTKYGICVIDKFLGEATAHEILKEVVQIQSAGIMKQGQLVDGPSGSSNKYIRGDIITWVEGTEPRTENINFLISCMDTVVLQSAIELESIIINERTKAMVACYPGRRTRYVRHVDNPNGDGRCITALYYLNENWDARQHGGLLRIYPEGEDRVANIEPKLDRLVFFWSDRRNPHEVEQAFKERFAITVWYYDAEERAEALKRARGTPESSNIKQEAVPLIKDCP